MKKRFLAALIILCMVLALCPISAIAGMGSSTGVSTASAVSSSKRSTPNVTRATSVLAFSSDVHNQAANGSANRLSTWMDNVINMYGKIDYMGFCGDMGDASANESNFWSYTQAVMNVVSNHNVPAVYTTGNHEHYNGNYSSTTNSVASNYLVGAEGANGSNFRIYALGTDNWTGSSDNYTEAQANQLTNYLNSVDNSKPIIILTHFPLHNCSSGSSWWGGGRTTVNADLIIDALNNASAAGKTIILLWGHNHTMSDTLYDEIMAPGYTINYTSSATKTIQFYYAAAGCMSDSEYGSGSAYVKGKGLVITVDGSTVDFHYYDANGNDVTENGGEPITTEPTTSETPSSGTTQPENGKTYVIISSDGYALTSEGDTVGYTNGSSGSQQYNYLGLVGKAYTLGETVTTDLLWTFNTSGSGYTIKSQDGRYLNATYVSNDSGGYDANLKLDSVTDVWTVSGSYLKTTNGSQSDSGDKFLSHGNGSESSYNMFTVRSEDNATTFVIHEYDTNGTYIGSEPVDPSPSTGTTEIRYVETSTLTAGNDYILAVGTGSSVNAITTGSSSSSTVSATTLTVTDNYIVTDNSKVIWNRTSAGYFQNGSNYLYPTSGNGIMVYSSGREINYSNGHLSYETSSSGTYYITYSNGFSATNDESSASTFRLFVKTTVSGGETQAPATESPVPSDPATGTLTQVSGFENGKKYVIVADDGYALTCNATDVSYSNSGSGSQSYVYTGLAGVVFNQNSITTNMLWTAQSSGSGWNLLDESGRYLNATYASNGNGYTGNLAVDSTADVWTVSSSKLRSANASDGNSSDKFLVHGNSSSSSIVNVFSVRSSSNASTVTIYEYNGTATPVTESPVTPTPSTGTTEIRYIETSTLTAGNDYILAVGTGNSVNAITAGSSSSSTVSATTLTVTDNYIVTDNSKVIWNRTSAGYFQNGSNYLYPTSGNGIMVYSSGRAINYSNGHLSYETSSSGTYYITYSNGFSATNDESSASTFRLFVKTEVSTGETQPPVTDAPVTEVPVTPGPTTGTLTQVSGFENGKKYVIVANDGYALTCNDTDASFSNSGSGTQSYNYTGLAGVVFNQNSITTDMLWTAQSSGSGWNLLDQSGRYLNGTYTSNGNGYDGNLAVNSTADVWTLSSSQLKSANASSGSSSDKYLAHSNGNSTIVNVFTVRSSSSAATLTIYEYTGSETPVTEAPVTEAPVTEAPVTEAPVTPAPTTGSDYRFIETDRVEADKEYIIAVSNGTNTVAAIAAGSGTSSSAVTLNVLADSNYNYIETENTAVVWTRTSSDFFQNGSNYLYPTSGNGILVYSSGRALSYENGHLFFATSSSGTYYITYSASSGFGTSNSESSAAQIRLFVKTEVGENPSFLLGDVNQNGTVDASDAILVMRYTLQMIDLTDLQLLAGDVNGNGTVDASDAILIMRKVLGLID